MVKTDKATWKANYFKKLEEHLREFPKILIVSVDNVGSHQMQEIRLALRGHGEVVMGKNTMIRKCIRSLADELPQLESLLDHVRGNVGFVFTKGDLSEIKSEIQKFKVKAPAKAGAFAPNDVWIDAGNTSMGPEKTSFFQALNIPTKINKGTIEILNNIHIVKAGERVGASEATLLNMLAISPFSYGLVPLMVYDNGAIFEPKVLDFTNEELRTRFLSGVRNIAALSLAINYPTMASVPHSIVNGLKNLISVAVMTDISFPAAEKAKAFLKDPNAFAAAAAAAAPKAAAAPAAAAAAGKPAKAPEPEPEDDDGGVMSLFD